MKPILFKKKNYFTDERGVFYEMFKKKNIVSMLYLQLFQYQKKM